MFIGRRGAHEMCLMVAGLMLAVGYMSNRTPALSAQWQWVIAAMYVLFAVGSLLGLVGCLWRSWDMALGIEQTGLLLQSAGLVIYIVAVFAFAGLAGWVVLTIFTAWLIANLARTWEIQRDIRALRKAASLGG
jgi:hypothetical protein